MRDMSACAASRLLYRMHVCESRDIFNDTRMHHYHSAIGVGHWTLLPGVRHDTLHHRILVDILTSHVESPFKLVYWAASWLLRMFICARAPRFQIWGDKTDSCVTLIHTWHGSFFYMLTLFFPCDITPWRVIWMRTCATCTSMVSV